MIRPSEDNLPRPTATVVKPKTRWISLDLAPGVTYYLTPNEAFQLSNDLVDAAEEQQKRHENWVAKNTDFVDGITS